MKNNDYEYALEVNNLVKEFPLFRLDNVSFRVKKGEIMGFVGRNGAGKTTTLKCILNIMHPNAGEVSMFGSSFTQNEQDSKERLSLLLGGVDYYGKTKLKYLTSITKHFYKKWDDNKYESLLRLFNLDENKRVNQLSQGMKVKYGLAIALSHGAELLILDEPTSGLDPISRDDLLDIFLDLVNKENVSILFSTHITSDLDKCADSITYIHDGKILISESLQDYKNRYLVIKTKDQKAFETIKSDCVRFIARRGVFEGLIEKSKATHDERFEIIEPTLDDIMVYFEKGVAK